MKIINLHSLCLAAAAAWLFWNPAAKADPADASDPQVDMQIDDQPGYQPSAEEEQLAGPFERQIVFFRTTEAPGTIVVHTADRYLYLVQPNNRAIRYGIGVGRDGFQWAGIRKIIQKQEWPDWRPPPEMIQRQPYLPRFMAAAQVIQWVHAHSTLAAQFIVSMAPTSRKQSAMPSPLAASAW